MSFPQPRTATAGTDAVLALPNPLPKSIGYSIMRSGGAQWTACIVVSYLHPLQSMTFDPISKRALFDLGPTKLSLDDLPSDIAKLLAVDPSRVSVLTVDTLSRPRSFLLASSMLAKLN